MREILSWAQFVIRVILWLTVYISNACVELPVLAAYWSIAGPLVMIGLVAIWGWALVQILWLYSCIGIRKFIYTPALRVYNSSRHVNGRV